MGLLLLGKCVCDDFCHALYTFIVGMYSVRKHLVAVVCKKCMQINDLQAVFLRYFLLYGDDAVGDDRIVDVPAGFEGRDRCAEENLWLGCLFCLGFFAFLLFRLR